MVVMIIMITAITINILILSSLNNKLLPARVLQLGRSSGGGDDFDDHGVLKQGIGWCDGDLIGMVLMALLMTKTKT